jgi:hypothetical protein
MYIGDMSINQWNRDIWEGLLKDTDILVMTAQVLPSLLPFLP